MQIVCFLIHRLNFFSNCPKQESNKFKDDEAPERRTEQTTESIIRQIG